MITAFSARSSAALSRPESCCIASAIAAVGSWSRIERALSVISRCSARPAGCGSALRSRLLGDQRAHGAADRTVGKSLETGKRACGARPVRRLGKEAQGRPLRGIEPFRVADRMHRAACEFEQFEERRYGGGIFRIKALTSYVAPRRTGHCRIAILCHERGPVNGKRGLRCVSVLPQTAAWHASFCLCGNYHRRLAAVASNLCRVLTASARNKPEMLFQTCYTGHSRQHRSETIAS